MKRAVSTVFLVIVSAGIGAFTYRLIDIKRNLPEELEMQVEEEPGETIPEKVEEQVFERSVEDEIVPEVPSETAPEEIEEQVSEEPVRDEIVPEVPSGPPYPLKSKTDYPLIDEIKNHEIHQIIKDRFYKMDDRWIQDVTESEENHIIDLAYKDLENTNDVEYKDYAWQNTLFKDYLEKHYAALRESYEE